MAPPTPLEEAADGAAAAVAVEGQKVGSRAEASSLKSALETLLEVEEEEVVAVRQRALLPRARICICDAIVCKTWIREEVRKCGCLYEDEMAASLILPPKE